MPMDTARWRNQGPALLAALATLAALLACLPPVATPFFLVDDPIYVRDNTALQQVPLAEWWRVFTERTNPWEYLPLRDLSYRVDLALFGLNAAGFRAHNLLLYALCCGAVWWCAGNLFRLLRGNTSPGWFAAFATALFALHPVHVESVAWVSGRKDLLSGLWALISLALFAAALRNRNRWALILSYAAFAAAILSKSTVVPLPLFALLLAVVAGDTPRFSTAGFRRAVVLTAPLFLLAAVSVMLQTRFGVAATGADSVDITGTARGGWERLLLAVKILGQLTRIAVCPVSLSLVYDVEAPGATAAWGLACGVAGGLAAAAGAWFALFRKSLAGFGIAFAGLFLVPFLQLIPFSTWSYASDRFLFLPVLGLAMAVAAGLSGTRSVPRAAGGSLLALALGMGLLLRSMEWRDGRGLIAQAGLRAPTHPIAGRLALHHVYMAEDRFDDARAAVELIRIPSERAVLLDYVDAKEALKRGDKARLLPLVQKLAPYTPKEDAIARRELANMAQFVGLHRLAEDQYRGLLRDFPDSAEVHYNLGLALAKQRKPAEAAAEMERAVAGGFATAVLWNNLALARRDAGQMDKAREAFGRAMDLDPDYWHPAYNLARLLLLTGDTKAARDALRSARERASRRGDVTAAIDELERSLAAVIGDSP